MPIVRNAQTKAFYANCGGAPRYHPLEHALFEHAVCVQRVCLRCKIHQGKNHVIIYSNLSRNTSRKSTYLYNS